MAVQPDFAFVDETGVAKDMNQTYFGVGAIIVHKNHLELNKKLRQVFLAAVDHFRALVERFEFKFTYITPNSLPFYIRLVEILAENENDWTFIAKLEKRKQKDSWQQYLKLLQEVFHSRREKCIVLADYFDEPKRAKKSLATAVAETKSILGLVQVESQGIMLLQAIDILLGALAFSKRSGNKDKYKQQVADQILKLLKQKEKPL